MRVLLDVAIRLPHLRWVNFGGGLGIPYKPGEKPLPLAELGKAISALMTEFAHHFATAHQGRVLELRIEPGRFLVAEAGTLLTTVTSIKTNPGLPGSGLPGRTFVGCDTGFNHLIRPAMYGAYHRIENLSRPDAQRRIVDVVGNICESSDFFAKDYPLQEPQLGDILALCDSGAYGMAMASTYNLRPLAAEVVLDGATVSLARRRQRVEELLESWEW
jgi:diaminopimelate decarboxylase